MEHLHGRHEGAHAHLIALRLANFFGLVEHGVEFADFVTEADGFKQSLDGGAVPQALEVGLLDADLVESRREEEIDGLGLVAVVGVVGHRTHLLVRDVHADRWTAESTVLVLGLANLVGAVHLRGLGKIDVGLEFPIRGVTLDALGGVPVEVSPHGAKGVVRTL